MMPGPRETDWSMMEEEQEMSMKKLGSLFELLSFVLKSEHRAEEKEETMRTRSVSWDDGDYVKYEASGEESSATADLHIHRKRIFVSVGPDEGTKRQYRIDRPDFH